MNKSKETLNQYADQLADLGLITDKPGFIGDFERQEEERAEYQEMKAYHACRRQVVEICE